MLEEKLLGTWKLASFTGTDEDGETVHIMGEDATGFICYSQDGWVSVEILRSGRPRYSVPDTELGTDAQTLAAARGMFAYAGRFVTDEENQIVLSRARIQPHPELDRQPPEALRQLQG